MNLNPLVSSKRLAAFIKPKLPSLIKSPSVKPLVSDIVLLQKLRNEGLFFVKRSKRCLVAFAYFLC